MTEDRRLDRAQDAVPGRRAPPEPAEAPREGGSSGDGGARGALRDGRCMATAARRNRPANAPRARGPQPAQRPARRLRHGCVAARSG